MTKRVDCCDPIVTTAQELPLEEFQDILSIFPESPLPRRIVLRPLLCNSVLQCPTSDDASLSSSSGSGCWMDGSIDGVHAYDNLMKGAMQLLSNVQFNKKHYHSFPLQLYVCLSIINFSVLIRSVVVDRVNEEIKKRRF